MNGRRPPYLDEHTEPIPARIAAGLHKIGLAMKRLPSPSLQASHLPYA